MSLCFFERLVQRSGLSSLLLTLVVAACGGGGDDAGGQGGWSANPPPQLPAALMRAVKESTGLQCATGGVRVDAGVDVNRDGVLADEEVTSIQYVCATAGSAGLGTLVRMRAETAGANCAGRLAGARRH
jgi:hypothetical protein